MKELPPVKHQHWHPLFWVLFFILITGTYGILREYDYRSAVRLAQVVGFGWESIDPFDVIQKNWRLAFRKETWGTHKRVLNLALRKQEDTYCGRSGGRRYFLIHGYSARKIRDLWAYHDLLSSLRPAELLVLGCENVDALKGLTSLRHLSLRDSPSIQNPDVFKGLSGLEKLTFHGYDVLLNLNALKELNGLRYLKLSGSFSLRNAGALKNLTGLQKIYLEGCRIDWTDLYELRAALPKTDITFPDGSKSPPE